MRFDVLTLFPGMFPGYLAEGMLRIAQDQGRLQVRLWDFRQWSGNRHGKVDDRPYGGGPGMVLRPEPVVETVEAVRAHSGSAGRVILLSPQGQRLTQQLLAELSAEEHLILVCGRYEGFDERIRQLLEPTEISIGDYVLTGGELPALVLIDGITRLIPGVLGHEEATRDDSFQQGLLEHAHYTRPPSYRGLDVPAVLRSGNHQEIARWRREQALERTKRRRADLLRSDHAPDDS